MLNDLPFLMLKCLLITITIEIIVAIILKIRKGDLLIVLLVNTLTNPLLVSLNVMIGILYGKIYYYVTLIILEILVLFIEGYIYKKVIDYRRINPYKISFILNMGSYFIGELINIIF